MTNVPDKKRSEYSPEELKRLESDLADYWDKSRDKESETVTDLEKHLWLANGAAATAAVGFIQAWHAASSLQLAGAWSFLAGIVALVVLKFISAFIASRDRYRFQDASNRFELGSETGAVFTKIRDRTFRVLKTTYLVLQWGAGVLFVTGLVLTMLGVSCVI